MNRHAPTPTATQLAPWLVSLAACGLLACSGSSDGPREQDPPPAVGIGPGATSDYVFYVATAAQGAAPLPFVAELGGTRRRALDSALDGDSLTLQGYSAASVAPDGRHLWMTTINGSEASLRVVDVAAGTWEELPLGFDGINLRASSYWSPDASRLAYLWLSDEPEANLRLYYPDADQLVTPEPSRDLVTVPLAWSTDSSYFGVRSYLQSPFIVDLDVFDRDGNRRAQVIPEGLSHPSPALAFSSEHLAFTPEYDDPGTGIVTRYVDQHDLAAGTSTTLQTGSDEYSDVAYSPNGEWLTWTAREDTGGFEPGRLFLADAVVGGPAVQISSAQTPGDARLVSWNPSSSLFAWSSTPNPSTSVSSQLNVTNLTGTTVSTPLPGFLHVRQVVWSPDGAWLACLGAENDPIYVVQAGSTAPATALVFSGSAASPTDLQWTPDSTHLLWLNLGPGNYSVVAWERGASPIARLVGPDAAPSSGTNAASLAPTRDSSSVVWIKRDGQGLQGIAVTPLDAPQQTRILSSNSGVLDLTSVSALEVR